MVKKQVKDNAYYEERLQREHPSIYVDLKAGKYRTVSEAATAAGLKQVRTRLHEMKNSWLKATTAEQMEFLRYLVGCEVTLSCHGWPMQGFHVQCQSKDQARAELFPQVQTSSAQ